MGWERRQLIDKIKKAPFVPDNKRPDLWSCSQTGSRFLPHTEQCLFPSTVSRSSVHDKIRELFSCPYATPSGQKKVMRDEYSASGETVCRVLRTFK